MELSFRSLPPVSPTSLDLRSRNVIARCNSSGPLYPLHLPASASTPLALHASTASSTLWHCRLGHPSHELDTFPTFTNFFAYVSTQFGTTIQGIQCDNGREFDNFAAHAFLSMASTFVEALNTATYLLNLLPTTTLQSGTPHQALFVSPPSYDHLRVFGCCCYPNLFAIASHKLAPRSTQCVFLGYSAHHKEYRCLDLSSNRVIIS
ncbi:hypothetical protein U9M48_039565 [Paspalum notatum var. saurae]|uniref:Retroviral polymerase SH3-like domain-containing protein n=1 Tax=Paspalum notatum var. saurae TaxID=547442 RepID=A0AAQ3XEQ4_PASNO